MNKYFGFYELKAISLPAVQWSLFSYGTILDTKLLWTVRVAVEAGPDINLPRFVGVAAHTAQQEGRKLLDHYGEGGIVIYYPYFIAEKSGVMEVSSDRLVIEAVNKDLWNLVSYGHKNLTIILKDDYYDYEGDRDFLQQLELLELERCVAIIRGHFRSELAEGHSVLAEWSYAYNTDIGRQPAGSRFLVFFELRTI